MATLKFVAEPMKAQENKTSPAKYGCLCLLILLSVFSIQALLAT